ncbi:MULTISPECIES: carbohydrate ABC transporter permease [Kosmotoga]|jgi:inositol-phosphate transport system permease protein|uniref:Binding-protein-dependent transport systems inner membrane component n=2 Tax=Kosmotoga TaxID=651456 RepID=C5CH27_KOSOT|nr:MULTISPECIES: carbohydrate ABC transporter permease [Kosmotoga]ACR79692.1 binding-protein-dependent transport systems inner membrane component [Kosmotoga olearia TBF 19.5.1]MDI3524573.1 inositol-phosphate transport system permease protein [Kosmotoga sp.]MDK2953873.1 inositol-phosphate transport system permease protein [Kosmotoga sp.]
MMEKTTGRTYKITFFQRKKEKIASLVIYTILIVVSLPIVLGYLWLFLSSFSENMKYGIIPTKLTLHNWRFLWESIAGYPNIWHITLNTLIVALMVMFLELFITSFAGYALSRFKFKGRRTMLMGILVLHSFPSVSLLVAIYYVLKVLGLINNLWGVILLKAALEIPWGAWIMKGFYDQLPWELEWAGVVDGYSRIQVFFKVILPLVKPGLAVTAIFGFLSGWGEFIFINTFILDQQTWTLSRLIKGVIGDFRFVDYGLLTAVSLFYMLPTLVFYLFTNKYLLEVNITGTKG